MTTTTPTPSTAWLRYPEPTACLLLRRAGIDPAAQLILTVALRAVHAGRDLAVLRNSFSANDETVSLYELADGTWFIWQFDGNNPATATVAELWREHSRVRAETVFESLSMELNAGFGLRSA